MRATCRGDAGIAAIAAHATVTAIATLATSHGGISRIKASAADTTSASDGTKYSSALHAGIMGQLAAGTTWTRARIRRRRTT